MNRARRRGIENEQKGPSCLDRNVKIIGRALSTGLRETMTTGGGPRMSPQPSIVLLLVVLVPCWKTPYRDAVEDKRGTLSRARIVHGLAERIFQESILYLSTGPAIPRNISFHWREGGEVTPRRGFFGYWGEISANLISWRDVLNDPWNCFYQSIRILTIFTGNFSYVSLFITCVFERIVTFDLDKVFKEEDFGLFLFEKFVVCFEL